MSWKARIARCCVPGKEFPAVFSVFADSYGSTVLLACLFFYLKDNIVGEERVNILFACIISAQTICQALGHFVLGTLASRIDAKIVIIGIMVGNVIFYASTALVPAGVGLLGIRAAAGFFIPTVPCQAFIAERLNSEQQVSAQSKVFIGFIGGWLIGYPISGFTFIAAGWIGVNVIAAGVCVVSVLLMLRVPTKTKEEVKQQSSEQQKISIYKLMREPFIISYSICGFATGFPFSVHLTQRILVWSLQFKMDSGDIGLASMCIFSFFVVVLKTALPRLVNRLGSMRGILFFLTLQIIASLLCCVNMGDGPPSWVFFCIATMLMIFGVVGVNVSNASRLKKITVKFANGKGAGLLAGFNRVLNATGDAIGPVAADFLMRISYGPASASPVRPAYIMTAGLASLTIALHFAMGINMLREPEW